MGKGLSWVSLGEEEGLGLEGSELFLAEGQGLGHPGVPQENQDLPLKVRQVYPFSAWGVEGIGGKELSQSDHGLFWSFLLP